MDDYVSFEIAKKLKEKGFREKCLCRYCNYSKTLCINEVEPKIARKIDYSEFFKCYNSYVNSDIDAPTISQVLEWLRKEKKMHIIIPASFDEGYWWEVRDFNREISEYSDIEYTSYEEAALAGIKYVLDNLI